MKRALLPFLLAAAAHAQTNTVQVDPTDPRYAANCPAPVDLTGHASAQCEIDQAVADAQTPVPGLPGFRTLVFPPGFYLTGPAGNASAIRFTKRVNIRMDPRAMLVLPPGPSSGISYVRANDCGPVSANCRLFLEVNIGGSGHVSTGEGLSLLSTSNAEIEHSAINNFAGHGLNLEGGSERIDVLPSVDIAATLGIHESGDTNENNIAARVIESGAEEGTNICYDSAACDPKTGVFRTTGVPGIDPHMAVVLDGVLNVFTGSIKSTRYMGGLKCAVEACAFRDGYVETATNGPSLNTDFVAGQGRGELVRGPGAIAATATAWPVTGAHWGDPYVGDPQDATAAGPSAGRDRWAIMPLDYALGDTTTSAYAPVPRNTKEWVSVAAFAGDGQVHLFGTRSGKAWPAGSWVMEQQPRVSYGVTTLENVHLNGLQDWPWTGGWTNPCSDTAQQPLASAWQSTRSLLCAEVIAGAVPDGYLVPFPHQHYGTYPVSLRVVGNSVYTTGLATSEQDGQGWIKIPSNAVVTIDQGDYHKRGPAMGSMVQYQNGGAQVQVLTDGTARALGTVMDPSGGWYLNQGTLQAVADANNAVQPIGAAPAAKAITRKKGGGK